MARARAPKKIDSNGWPEWAPRVCSRCGQKVILKQSHAVAYSVRLDVGRTLHLDPADCPPLRKTKTPEALASQAPRV
jgi:hypothetical protein